MRHVLLIGKVNTVNTVNTQWRQLDSDLHDTLGVIDTAAPVTVTHPSVGHDTTRPLFNLANKYKKVEKDFFSANCIFALIDSRTSDTLSNITTDTIDLDIKTSQASHPSQTPNPHNSGLDSGYESTFLTHTNVTHIENSSGSLRSDVPNAGNSPTQGLLTHSSHHTNSQTPPILTTHTANVTSTPVKNFAAPARPFPSQASFFTDTQKTGDDLVFMYMSPGQLAKGFTISRESTPSTQQILGPSPKLGQRFQKNSDTKLDTTLEVLESLDTEIEKGNSESRPLNSHHVEFETHTMDKPSTPKRLIKKATLEFMRKPSQIPDGLSLNSKSYTQPPNPNIRNAKRKLIGIDTSLDLERPKSKINKTNGTPSIPYTQSVTDFVSEVTSGKNTPTSLTITSRMTAPLQKQLNVGDFITQVTESNFQGNTCLRTPDPKVWQYQKVTDEISHLPKTRTSLLRPPQGMTGDEEIPYFLRDKNRDDRDDWFIGRREMACSTRQTLRRSYIRQSYQHNLLTEWATGNEGMPPW